MLNVFDLTLSESSNGFTFQQKMEGIHQSIKSRQFLPGLSEWLSSFQCLNVLVEDKANLSNF